MAARQPSKKSAGHIFISHAEADRDLVDALVDLIVTGVGLNHNQIFCTSLEGLGIPEGESFIDFIQKKMQDPSLVLMVITPSYYESLFCVCELGATWAMSHSAFPLICPPLTFSDLKAVLSDKQAAMIDRQEKLDSLRDRVIKDCGIKPPPSTARWNSKRDQFLKKLPNLLCKTPGATKVSIEKYEELKETYGILLEDNAEFERQMEKQKEIIEKLKSAKDASEVANILIDDMEEWDQYEHLIIEAKSKLGNLPRVVVEALYYRYNGGTFSPVYWDKEYLREEVKEAEERKYITSAGYQRIEPNMDKPPVSKADGALRKLSDFLANASAEFYDAFTEKNDLEPSMEDRDFWENELDLISS